MLLVEMKPFAGRAKRKRALRGTQVVSEPDAVKLARMLPYA